MLVLQQLVEPLLALCHTAAQVICEHYHAPGAELFEAKGDDTPLTLADLASDKILLAGLTQLDPQFPVLSEESPEAQMAQRRNWSTYWLVDPLDGTKEFLSRTGEFTINIALIQNHVPVFGILYLPLKDTAYVGIPGDTALRYQRDSEGQFRSEPVTAAFLRKDSPLVLLASRRHRGPRLADCLNWLESNWGPVERRNSGSALKFCRLAEGEGDFYPRFSACCEWDVAAGQALVEAAGGAILGLDGLPLRYNERKSLYSPNFYAIADPAHGLWDALLARNSDHSPGGAG